MSQRELIFRFEVIRWSNPNRCFLGSNRPGPRVFGCAAPHQPLSSLVAWSPSATATFCSCFWRLCSLRAYKMRAPHGNHLKLEVWDEIRTFFRKHLGLYGVRHLLPCLRWPWIGGNKSQDVTKSKDGCLAFVTILDSPQTPSAPPRPRRAWT